MAASVTEPTPVRARVNESVAPALILLVEVFVFMAALVGIALINAGEAARTANAIANAKLATRQQTLAERIGKDLGRIALVPADPVRNADAATDIASSFAAVNATQAAFTNGGATTDLAGASIRIRPLTTAAERDQLTQIDTRLAGMRSHLAPLANPQALPADADAIARAAIPATESLADATGQLAAQVSAASQTDGPVTGSTRDWLFRVVIIMVLAMVVTLFRRVNASRAQLQAYADDLEARRAEATAATHELAEAKAGSDLIMETVDRGLFLIRADLRIDGQYSRELENIFRSGSLNGYNFLNVLQNLLTERVFDISRDYLGLLFDPKKKERTVLRVNPLSEVEVHFANPAGGFDSKFLNFSFRRIVEDGVVTRVFVAVSDITERVRLERQLRESEARKERQFEFLLGILHVEPKALDDFLKTAAEQIAIMNDALRASDFATPEGSRMELLRQRLDVVYRAVHTVKGNAAMLRLSYFQKVCDAFELKILALRDRRALSGDDFLTIVIAQSELRQDIEELQDLRTRFVGAGSQAAMARTIVANGPVVSSDVASAIGSLALQIAGNSGRQVAVDSIRFSTDGLSDDVRRAVKDVLVQLTRNAVAHGVEAPEERRRLGKPPTATLTIASADRGDAYALTFRDDGRGLDPTVIREKAVERKLISPQAAAGMSDRQVVALIFRSGFSTLDDATSDAGRGIGMNVIKEIVVDRLGGRMTLNSEPGKFTEFGFELPRRAAEAASDAVPELSYS